MLVVLLIRLTPLIQILILVSCIYIILCYFKVKSKGSAPMEVKPLIALPQHVLASQICKTCNRCLSAGPVVIDANNTQACGRCLEKKDGTPSLYNIVAKYCIFKCDHVYQGCSKSLYYNEVAVHAMSCTCKCNMASCQICDINLLNYSHLMNHYKLLHPEVLANIDAFKTFDISEGEGLHFYILDANIIRVNWTTMASKLRIGLNGEGKSLATIGITHYQVTVCKGTCFELQLSSPIVKCTSALELYLNDLHANLDLNDIISYKVRLFVEIDGRYVLVDRRDAQEKISEIGKDPLFECVVQFFCLTCTTTLREHWYCCINSHKICNDCFRSVGRDCPECDLHLKKTTTPGTATLKLTRSSISSFSTLKVLKQATLLCPWKKCPLNNFPENIIDHQLNCKFRHFYCPSTDCKEPMTLDQLNEHWHLDTTPLKILNFILIRVTDGFSIYWVPDHFKNLFKVVVNYLDKSKVVIVDVLNVDVILMHKHDFRLRFNNETYKPVKVDGHRIFTIKGCVKEHQAMKLEIIHI